jgi:hypothetical protein
MFDARRDIARVGRFTGSPEGLDSSFAFARPKEHLLVRWFHTFLADDFTEGQRSEPRASPSGIPMS